MSEVLGSMKLIKMYAWEESFKQSVLGTREKETRPLLLSTISNLICNSIIPVTPSLATVATISSYVNAGNQLTASTSFSIVSTLNFLQIIISFIPTACRIFGETRISFERIKRFMLEDEFTPPHHDVKDKGNAIELKSTVFMWDGEGSKEPSDKLKLKELRRHPSTTSLVLQSIDLTVRRGKHIGICGAVGCGKSSLLQALIGRMPLITGQIAVDGQVAYAAQQAWIFNGTLRENVLFGKPYQKDWYTKVVNACSLYKDIRILANGDLTEIGDKGINLSGGQKQRVSLARAVYSKSDIYLLDDPLSAVDVHVGQHLFHMCIDKVLKNKTVVLVTHQLQYLKHCDEIYVMDDGEITEHGTHDSLLALHGQYTKVMEQYNSKMYFTDTTDDHSIEEDGTDKESIDMKTNQQQNDMNNSMAAPSLDQNYEKGILTNRETSAAGDITRETYMSYVNAGGGKIVTALVILLYMCFASSVAFSEWWLGIWIEQTTSPAVVALPSELSSNATNLSVVENVTLSPEQTTNTTFSMQMEDLQERKDWYLNIYIYTSLVIAGLAVLKALAVGKVMVRASVNLHNKAVRRIMHAPMQYFDANPSGRLLNRFLRDVDEG
ncbi:multidrug resistance-associated protein 9-like [Pecten maximus]|uniref:multidrug resistance-associated protein 9-like n=1 Tax=Pecten maximus TaxID=6579 RepID=UPI00145815A9|nr:multidrug resistance-associated protein 9-like [Pecten maximus]